MNFELSLSGALPALDKISAAEIMSACVRRVTIAVHDKWMLYAGRALHSTRQDYMRGLILVDKGPFEGQIVLTGAFNNMLEKGFPSFDMKPGLLRSPRAKTSVAGKKYVTIPFKHSQPGAVGEGFANSLPPEIYATVQKLKPGGRIGKSGQPVHQRAAFTDPVTKKYWPAYKSKYSKTDNLVKTQKKGGYTTFRRVSEASNPDSWIHPGFKGVNAVQSVLQDVDVNRICESVIQAWANS